MERYINADALQQKMTQLRLEQSGDMDKINLIWQVQDMILQAPTADVREVMNSAWIPVAERLPDIDMSYPHSDLYLVCTDAGEIGVVYYTNANLIMPQYVTKPRWDVSKYTTVLAWMPLPEPYTADNPKWEELPYKGENIERGNGLP